jgi:hypothetical protein
MPLGLLEVPFLSHILVVAVVSASPLDSWVS